MIMSAPLSGDEIDTLINNNKKKRRFAMISPKTSTPSHRIKPTTDSAPQSGLDIEDRVHLSATQWDFPKSTDPKSDSDPLFQSDLEIEINNRKEKKAKSDIRLLKSLGYQIDYKARLPELKSLYQYHVTQTKSHNYFVSKFSAFKIGVIGYILTTLGVTSSEMHQLKKDALTGAFNDNIATMNETIYHTELTLLVYGRTRQSRASLKAYHQTQTQLIAQMNQLFGTNYWSEKKLLETRYDQLAIIKDEFQKEWLDLIYHQQYLQGSSAPKLTDNLSSKITRIEQMIQRIDSRLIHYQKKINRLAAVGQDAKHVTTLGLRLLKLHLLKQSEQSNTAALPETILDNYQ